MNKALLLISSKPDDLLFAEQVALVSGLSLLTVKAASEGAKLLADDQVTAILVDTADQAHYLEFEDAIQEAVGLFSDKINANAIHFLTDANIDQVQYLIQSPLFGHYILRNFTNAAESGKHYGRIMRATQASRAYGLSLLLKEQAKVQKITLQLASQKLQAIEAIKGYLLAAKFQNRMATVIANAVDELLMNSIFDAPVDALGKPTLSQMPRSTEIQLTGKNLVELQIGYDGEYVGVTASDLYGSLDKNRLLSHISKIYKEEEYRVRTAVAGAGIGLATVFRTGGSFFFVSEQGVRTEVTVFFKRTDNFREFKDQFRFISTQFYF